jgi:hypothetical protein
MRKILIFLLFIPFITNAQNPIQVSQAYQYNKYIKVIDSLISQNISLPRQTSFPTPKRTGQIVNKQDTLFYYTSGGVWVKLSKNTWPQDSSKYASKSALAFKANKSDTIKVITKYDLNQGNDLGTYGLISFNDGDAFITNEFDPNSGYAMQFNNTRYILNENGLSAFENYGARNISNQNWLTPKSYVDSMSSGQLIDTSKIVTNYNLQSGITFGSSSLIFNPSSFFTQIIGASPPYQQNSLSINEGASNFTSGTGANPNKFNYQLDTTYGLFASADYSLYYSSRSLVDSAFVKKAILNLAPGAIGSINTDTTSHLFIGTAMDSVLNVNFSTITTGCEIKFQFFDSLSNNANTYNWYLNRKIGTADESGDFVFQKVSTESLIIETTFLILKKGSNYFVTMTNSYLGDGSTVKNQAYLIRSSISYLRLGVYITGANSVIKRMNYIIKYF